MMWIPTSNKYGVAIHNWHGDVTHGLALDVGDCVEILEETTHWFRGTCPRKPRKVGLFPKSYIHLKDLAKVDPVVGECTLVLREWSEIWKKLFVEREEYKFTSLRKVMLALLESRRELLSATLTQDQTYDLQMKVISKIDWGNRKLGLDLVPRLGTLAVDPHKIGIVSLHQVHVNSAENAKAASNRGTLRRKAGKKILTHHLYFCMRDFGHRIGDDAEIYFYLYDGQRMRALSERFLVRIAKDGFSTYVETSNNCTVFTDLGSSDLNQDLYLIANVMRVGKMLHSESVKKGDKFISNHSYRRPYGVGVLPLSEIGQFDQTVESEEKEFSFKIFQCEEKDYHQLHELIIKKASGKFQPINVSTQGHYGLVVSLKLIHGGLGQARIEQPILFQGTAITKKIGFPDVIMPGDVRNDLFLTLERGEFERVGISTAKNIEITTLVLDENGRIIQECIAIASGNPLQAYYKSMVLYHNNSPAWNETIRMFVPIDKFSKAHVRFEFRSCSTRDKSDPKLFGFSFSRLMEPGGATIADASHELYVYKCEDILKVQPNIYLRLPCSATDKHAHTLESNSPYHRSSKEAFFVKTVLCSTKLTQNGDLLSLLQWRNHPHRIQDSLQRVLRLHNEELIKFLQDVLDALFAMFSTDDGNSTPHSGLVFHVLVSIFSLMQSSKFQHFKPVMDAYIKDHFTAPLVYKGLLSSVQHLADWMNTADNLEPILQCFSSLEFIFKLIIQSRKLFAHASGGQYEDKFKHDLFAVFTSLNGMLLVASHSQILPTQEALLSSIGVVFEQLRTIITRSELETLVKGMLDAVPKDAQPPLIQAKLKSIKDMVSGQLFQDDDLRSVILNIACKHLRIHLARRDELRLCSEILAEILIKLHEAKARTGEKPSNAIHHDLDTLFSNIFPILMQTINVLGNGGNESLVCALFAVMLGLLQLLDETHFQRMWDRLSTTGSNSKELKDFIQQCLNIFKDILEQDWMVFSKDWLVMKISANEVVRKTLEEMAKPLVYRFLGSQSQFDSQLWWSYFSVAVIFLTQPSLQIEQYHETKRRKLLSTHGDMRVAMGFQILSMWAQLGEHKLHFIPSMVGPFLEVTLVPEPALRKATFTVFYDMMQCEQVSRGSFRLVESELIDKLDLLISENKGDDEYRELFSTMEQLCLALLERVQAENPSWRESGTAFISSVTRLLERLLDYRSVMQGDENRDKRMTCTVNLLNFYNDEINRKEMYVRYIYKLLDLHLGAENYIEAGLTLKLYADMLSWDSENISDESNGPREWEQKEKIYKNIISYFDKGKCWEKGIPLCKELAMFYERKRFDYNRLSDVLIQEAKFFQNILTQLRPEPEYFRVGYYGTGFPSFVRNKQFIYRGLEYERIGAFIQRLQIEFPAAQILDKKHYPPDSSVLNSPEQRFHVVNVRPISDPSHLKSAKVTVPEKISKYYEVNDVTKFQYDRPVHKGIVDKDNEFKSLWIERTIYDTAQPLPGILRWFEVTNASIHELTPVEFACESVSNVNKELSDLIVQYRLEPKRNLNPFTMRLQGSVDANVNGGFNKYQDAFFTERFAKSPEGRDQSLHVQRLKRLIFEQMQILRQALELHRSLASEEVLPLHNRLSEAFLELEKSTAEWKTNINIPTKPLPPLPIANVQPLVVSSSVQQHYFSAEDHDETYTYLSRKTLSLSGIVPMTAMTSSPVPAPQVPPRDSFTSSPSAPPLPPRGHTPDKRNSNPMPFTEFVEQQQGSAPARPRSKKYSLYEISLNESMNHSYGSPRSSNEFKGHYDLGVFNRDSGISTSSQELNNLNSGSQQGHTPGHHHHHYHQPISTAIGSLCGPLDEYNISLNGNGGATTPRGHQKTNSNPESFNSINVQEMAMNSINTSLSRLTMANGAPQPPPPPIPPKSAALHHQHSFTGGSNHPHHQRQQSLNLSQNSSSDGDAISLNDISPAPPVPFNDTFSDSFSDECDSTAVAASTAVNNNNSHFQHHNDTVAYCVPKAQQQQQQSNNSNSLGRRSLNGASAAAMDDVVEVRNTTMVPLRHDDEEEEIFY